MQEENDKRFGGILGGLKRLIFNDAPGPVSPKPEEVAKTVTPVREEQPAPPAPAPAPVSNFTESSHEQSSIDEQELIQKIYQLFESINKPGVDFFELWNAAEKMGGPTPVNIQNAYTTLSILGLSKEMAMKTGREYLQEIDQKIKADVQSKQQEKDHLVLQLQQEKASLQSKESELEKQILNLQKALQDTKAQLTQVDSKYTKPIFILDDKMRVGLSALAIVNKEINAVLNTVEHSVK
ncbi:MAG: hypothetical protein BGO31_20345 [Bacteroidetes bacterium 43-16]|nr:MAG: hypothetical protein BGO31_20345 [Bacteroidetes bacterium 43-16]